MRRGGGLRELGDPCGFADIDAVDRDFSRRGLRDFGGDRLQPGLVAIRQRQIAAACGEFQCQGPADAARGACYGGGSHGSRSCGFSGWG